MFFSTYLLAGISQRRQWVCCAWDSWLCNLELCVRLQTSAFQYLGWVNEDAGQADQLATSSDLLPHPGTVSLQCHSHVALVFAQQDLICHLCGKDHFRDSKMQQHTAFRIGPRDLWIAGCSPAFIWDRWQSVVVHFEMQLSDLPSLWHPVIDTAAWELATKICDFGAILSTGSWGHYLQHNLGCLEDFLTCQPDTDSATIGCAVCLTPTRRIIQITSQELLLLSQLFDPGSWCITPHSSWLFK